MSLLEQTESTIARRVWLRAFWGFSPEDEGYLGFTHEGNRARFLREYRDGDLVLIYGADHKQTRLEQRRQVLGFLDVEPTPITDTERSSEADRQWRLDNGFLDRWTFALPVKRAWRINRRLEARNLVPEAFETHQAMLIASRGELLSSAETETVLALPVTPANVYGEPPLPLEQTRLVTTLNRVFEPSRGVTPSFGTRVSTIADSENYLYALKLKGDVAAFLGRQRYDVGRKAIVKIGIAKDPQDRCDTHNEHLPAACAFSWHQHLISNPFAGAIEAKEAEDRLKKIFATQSLGREFFLVDEDALHSEFSKVSPAKFVIKGR